MNSKQTTKYKSTGKRTLFDEQDTVETLSKLGNPLEKLSSVIDFEMFRERLESKLLNHNKKNNAGAKPFDVVMMFKIMILQRYYNLGDHQIEYQIEDRLSFKKFLGLESGDKVPDEKTVWAFRERLTNAGLIEELFDFFLSFLDEKGLIANEGQMVDASFVPAPRQRNTREENEEIKNGEGHQLWNDNPAKKRHKDVDARWTKKGDERYYGYKNSTKTDSKSKLIKKYIATDAAKHDSQMLDDLLDKDDANQPLYGDGAYSGSKQKKIIEHYKMQDMTCEKGFRNKPLTDTQKQNNRKKSKVRVRVEHVYGFMEQSMNGLLVRTVGLTRAAAVIGLINLTYNMFRFELLAR